MIRNTTLMDQTSNSAESTVTPHQQTNLTPQPSFNATLASLFGTNAPTLAKQTSHSIEHMAINSCHISFLKACRDHSFIPKGLRLTNPLTTKRSTEVLNHASNLLITERLTHYRLKYAQNKRTYEHNLRHIESLITPQYFQKLTHLNTKKSSYTHRRHLLTHQKKFAALLSEYDTPFLSPYDTLTTFDIPDPTFHGPLLKTTPTPTPKNDNTPKTVINLSGQTLSTAE